MGAAARRAGVGVASSSCPSRRKRWQSTRRPESLRRCTRSTESPDRAGRARSAPQMAIVTMTASSRRRQNEEHRLGAAASRTRPCNRSAACGRTADAGSAAAARRKTRKPVSALKTLTAPRRVAGAQRNQLPGGAIGRCSGSTRLTYKCGRPREPQSAVDVEGRQAAERARRCKSEESATGAKPDRSAPWRSAAMKAVDK